MPSSALEATTGPPCDHHDYGHGRPVVVRRAMTSSSSLGVEVLSPGCFAQGGQWGLVAMVAVVVAAAVGSLVVLVRGDWAGGCARPDNRWPAGGGAGRYSERVFSARHLRLFLTPQLLVVGAWVVHEHLDAAPSDPSASPSVAAQADRHAVLPSVRRVLRPGDTGPDVRALQRRLGLPASGVYDAATADAVRAFQFARGLAPDGIVGRWTLAVLRGHEPFFGYGWHHDPAAFVPRYPITAFHESGTLRSAADPYGVGAISRPGVHGDRGGPSYGVYQLSSAGDDSPLARFVAWPDNPFGARLGAAAARHGLASPAFDTTWRALARDHNAAFGQAQQAFLELHRGDRVDAFLAACGAAPGLRHDARLWDLAIGTLNQYGGLAHGIAAAARKRAGADASAAELGRAIQDAKAARVERSFASSPSAWEGVRARIARERRVFE